MTKTILLTGATGFLGSHLLSALVKEGYKMVILKRSFSNTWRINHLLEQITTYDINIVPFEQVFEEQKIDVVIHTATNYGRKGGTVSNIVDDNVLFGLKLFETALVYNTGMFFNTDTLQSKYLSYYTLSKKQFVEWFNFFIDMKNIKIVNLRLEHMYGPKDDNTKFVTWLIEQMLSNHDIINLTKGDQKRDFIYIDDIVSVYLLLLKKSDTLSEFNEFDVGSGSQITIKEFVYKLKNTIEMVNQRSVLANLNFGSIPYRKGEEMDVIENLDPLSRLGWKPHVKLDEGLKMVVKDFFEREVNK